MRSLSANASVYHFLASGNSCLSPSIHQPLISVPFVFISRNSHWKSSAPADIECDIHQRLRHDGSKDKPEIVSINSNSIKLQNQMRFTNKLNCVTSLDKQVQTAENSIRNATLRQKYLSFIALTKPKLSTLVLLTTAAGYSMAPQTCSIPPYLMLTTLVGTWLCIASANTFNQLYEIKNDSNMARTRTRPLCVSKPRISPREAWYFGFFTGLSGGAILTSFVGPVVGLLGVGNIMLYAGAYTPMKRTSVYNTQVGAIVGAIPPVMGYLAVSEWACNAATEGFTKPLHNFQAESDFILSNYSPTILVDALTTLSHHPHTITQPLLLASILYFWQFPHFNALSYSLRKQYGSAGYMMMADKFPSRNALECVLGSIGLCAASVGMVAEGMVAEGGLSSTLGGPIGFVSTTGVFNAWILWESWKFYQTFRTSSSTKKKEKAAKRLFHASLFHLPAIIVLMLLYKSKWPRSISHQQAQENQFNQQHSNKDSN